MLSKGTCVKIVLVSLLAVAVQHIARLVIMFGAFSHYYSHYPGPCHKVENMQLGSEDFETLPNGLTFITSGIRLPSMGPPVDEYFHKNNIKGRIFLLNFKNLDAGVKELKVASTDQFSVDTFSPHGISVWEDKKEGRHVVFVVNHPVDEPADRIEKFVYNPDKQELVHQNYYTGDTMKLVNDVQATGENSFYFTNYMYFRGKAGILEYVLQLHWTDVIYFDGKSYSVVATDIFSPNGITMSKDGHVNDVIAVSSTEFYITNVFTARSRGMMLLELLALMPWSNIVFCEHSLCKEVAGGLLGACGLALSSEASGERQYVYVAACLGTEIRVFRRNKDNSLTLQQIFPLNTAPDNIQVDPATGDLYIGCHPIGYKAMMHLEDPGHHIAPSQVLQLRVTNGNITSVQELFYDHGDLISGSTSALVYDRKLLIGSVLHNLVTCDVNIPL